MTSVLEKLAELETLDPAAAEEIRDCWPLTLQGVKLDVADDTPLLGSTFAKQRDHLNRHLDELLEEHA